MNQSRRGSRGSEMGEFSPPPPPLFVSPLLFFFFLSLKYWNNLWFLWFLWLRWRICISDDRFYQSIYSFWAHKHTVENVNYSSEINHADAQTSNTSTRLWFYYIIIKFTPHFKILNPRLQSCWKHTLSCICDWLRKWHEIFQPTPKA